MVKKKEKEKENGGLEELDGLGGVQPLTPRLRGERHVPAAGFHFLETHA